MQEKLEKLFDECLQELSTIGIIVQDHPEIGKIDIRIASRATKRYGCCKQEDPDKRIFHKKRIGRKTYIHYDKFRKHHIEISKWVMELDEKIIKNTIMHELIHCFPYCNDHGVYFKEYAKRINQQLGYDITRVGDKKADFEKSNLIYEEKEKAYRHKIICKKCGQIYERQRLQKNIETRYRCSKCGGKLQLIY